MNTAKLHIRLAWLAILGLLFWGLGSVPLTDIDEGAFAEASREMLVRGDWVSPWLLDAPRFDKPALIHWIQMVSFSVLGVNAWGARMPSALAGVAWIGGISAWAALIARHINRSGVDRIDELQAYFWTLVFSGGSIGILAIARASTADAVLNALMVLSLIALWQVFFSNSVANWARVCAFLIGLGLLTKGPIAVLIPGVASLVGALALGPQGWVRWGRMLRDPIAWLIVILVVLPWYWLQYRAQGMAFINGFFGLHNVGRFTSTMHGFSSGPWYYPAWTLIALIPWSPLAIRGLLATRVEPILRHRTMWMCWGVFIFVVVFFSFSATKLPHYGFYGLSGLLVVMGLTVATLNQLSRTDAPNAQARQRWAFLLPERIVIGTLLAALSALPLWWSSVVSTVADPYYQSVLVNAGNRFVQYAAWFVVPVIIAVVVVLAPRVAAIVVGGFTVSAIMYLGVGLTVIDALRTPIVSAARAVQGKSNVISWKLAAPSLSFAAGQVIKPGEPGPGLLVVMHEKDTQSLKEHLINRLGQLPSISVVHRDGGIQIVRID